MSGPIWSDTYLSDAGLRLRTEVIAEKGSIEFTRAEVGEGKPSSPIDIGAMTGLVNKKGTAHVVRSYVDRDNNHSFLIAIDNEHFANQILVTEFCIYARKVGTSTEIMYGYVYALAGAADLPPGNSQHRTWNVIASTKISRTAEIKIVYDGTGVRMTHAEFEKAIANYYTKTEIDSQFEEHNRNDNEDSHKDLRSQLANKANGRWTIFTEFEEIGISSGQETIKDIAEKLPDYCELNIGVGSHHNGSIYPIQHCFFRGYKVSAGRMYFEVSDVNNSANRWTGTYYVPTNFWSGWQKLAIAEPTKEFSLPVVSGLVATVGVRTTYYKNDFGNVFVQGSIQKAGGGNLPTGGISLAILPVGYRPNQGVRAVAIHWTPSVTCAHIDLNPNGTIYTQVNANTTKVEFQLFFMSAN